MKKNTEKSDGFTLPKFPRQIINIIFIFFVISGFAFFFTSRLWLPATGTITVTPVGAQYTVGNGSSTIMLKSMEFDASSGALIVDIGINNTSITSTLSYSVGAVNASGKKLDVEVLHHTSSFFILQFPTANDEKAISIRVQVQEITLDGGNAGKAKTYTFGAIIDSIPLGQDMPASYSEVECVLYDMKNDLNLLLLEKSDCESRLNQNLLIVENAREKINELEGSKEYMTSAELEDTNRQITQIQGSIDSTEIEIGKLRNQLVLTQQKIDDKTQKIVEYREANGL